VITPSESHYLNPADVIVHPVAGGGRPNVEVAGRFCLLGAKLRRCFPLTHADGYIGVLDAGGHEVGILADLGEVDEGSRKVIAEQLDAFYFTPSVTRIQALKQEASMWKWDVDTQRGPATFYLRGVRDSVHEVAPSRWQVYSVDGQRYEITNLDELDQRSQNLFESLF
jgi:hypothetical protein